MRKNRLLCLLPFLCLTSCSTVTMYGTYSFAMGKTGGTRIGATVSLINQEYTGKANSRTLNVKLELGETTSWITEILANGIEGYYYSTSYVSEKYGTELAIGAIFDHEHYPEIIPEDFKVDIPSELIEKVLTVYCNNSTVTIQVPVSEDDLSYQLAWYGYLVNLSKVSFSVLNITKLPGFDKSKAGDEEYEKQFMESRYGNHPVVTKDDSGKVISSQIDEMNLNFAGEFSNTPVYDKDAQTETKIGGITATNDIYYYYPEKDITDDIIYGKVEFLDGNMDVAFTIDQESLSPNEEGFEITEFKIYDGQSYETSTKLETKYYSLFYKEPLTFRDFHDVRVGLNKVTKD